MALFLILRDILLM